ncbi:hypothetical protein [Mycolicibacterium brumae]|uniref:hypothetical protein n=1 Tax=Mycolicibacterium brumae TaxID=85968 RepID=UPI000FE1EBE4|nr:hypothetical protein [Mycolicibacterium brumae]MCV7192009.1 hypothetical protein [Mycolicibacterium brumae]UWW07775.1 hypothetical protein L2Z93_000808 [Mycolicibacterium brumae]
MNSPAHPTDIWQLADALVALVPPSEQSFARLVGAPLTENGPYRMEGGPVELSPSLKITDSVIALHRDQWSFATVGVEPEPCHTADDVKAHYPTAVVKYTPHGHSPEESFIWSTTYDWGELWLAIREKDRCLIGVSIRSSAEISR